MPVTVSKPAFNLREALNSLRRKMGLKGSEILRAETVDDVYNVIGRNKNLLINGDMRINQRGGASYTNDSTYTLDRWKVGRYDSNHVQISQQASGLSAFPYCVRIQNPQGQTSNLANEIHLNQALESLDSAFTRGQELTLSFWARMSSAAGISRGASATIYFGAGTDNYVDYDYFAANAVGAVSKNFSLDATWKRYSVTAVAPTSTNQVGVAITKYNGSVTGQTNDYIEVTGVQLELGSVATPFEYRPYQQELALCQRYFYAINGVIGDRVGSGFVFSATNAIGFISHPVVMRASPSLFVTSQMDINDSINGYTVSAANVTLNKADKHMTALSLVTSGMTAPRGMQFYFTGGAGTIGLSAEI